MADGRYIRLGTLNVRIMICSMGADTRRFVDNDRLGSWGNAVRSSHISFAIEKFVKK